MPAGQPPCAVIDADIFYSRILHDLMGRVAGWLDLLKLVGSGELLVRRIMGAASARAA